MRRLFILILTIPFFLSCHYRSETNHTVISDFAMCGTMEDQNAIMASFFDIPDFIKKHPKPDRIMFVPMADAKNISFPTTDGKSANAYFIPSSKSSDKYLFVFHEWWGLNDQIRQEAEKYYEELGSVNVMAIDMYDGKVAQSPDQARQYMQSLSNERSQAILKGAFEYAGKNATVGTIGWCFGGGVSLQAALAGGKQVEACVIYYGMPVQDVERLKKLEAPVLGIFGKKDNYINPQVVAEFEKNMEKANQPLTVKMYDADHAFANPTSDRYNQPAAKDAWVVTIDFLEQHLMN